MQAIELEIPAEIVSQIRVPTSQAQQFLMQELVLRLYEGNVITSGQGACLLNKSRQDFERLLAEHHIAIHSRAEELEQDIAHLERVL